MAIEIREQVPLAPLTTFEIGGPAEYLCEVRTEDEIRAALLWTSEHSTKTTILAGGSNVLIADEGIEGLVMRIVEGEWNLSSDGVLESEAGCNLYNLIRACGEKEWGGWEKLAGIPGTIGGAVRGNAGAFGSEIKDFLISTRALNRITGEVREFSNAECDFSYRHSFFKDHSEWIITKATIRLAEVTPQQSEEAAKETVAERERRHLQNVRAAGSFFMNPVAPEAVVSQFEQEKNTESRGSRVPAGWLIEKVGMKGASVGGAVASEQHPNYLVNRENATAADVRELSKRIKTAVTEQFSVDLHEEAAVL